MNKIILTPANYTNLPPGSFQVPQNGGNKQNKSQKKQKNKSQKKKKTNRRKTHRNRK
jgi:hypothetical protein